MSLNLNSQAAHRLFARSERKRLPLVPPLIGCQLQMLMRRAGWPSEYQRSPKSLRAQSPPYETPLTALHPNFSRVHPVSETRALAEMCAIRFNTSGTCQRHSSIHLTKSTTSFGLWGQWWSWSGYWWPSAKPRRCNRSPARLYCWELRSLAWRWSRTRRRNICVSPMVFGV